MNREKKNVCVRVRVHTCVHACGGGWGGVVIHGQAKLNTKLFIYKAEELLP